MRHGDKIVKAIAVLGVMALGLLAGRASSATKCRSVATIVAVASSAPENLAVDCPFAYRHLVAINCEHSERWVDLCQAAERAGVSMHLVCVEASENCTMAKKCLGEP
jgi:hypothetical protein